MCDTLRAWRQDPDDWKVKQYNPKKTKPSLYKRIINWFRNLIFNTWMGFLFIILFFSSLGCCLAGPS